MLVPRFIALRIVLFYFLLKKKYRLAMGNRPTVTRQPNRGRPIEIYDLLVLSRSVVMSRVRSVLLVNYRIIKKDEENRISWLFLLSDSIRN